MMRSEGAIAMVVVRFQCRGDGLPRKTFLRRFVMYPGVQSWGLVQSAEATRTVVRLQDEKVVPVLLAKKRRKA